MIIAVSAFEWVQAVAGTVAALAALGALVFAWLTVRGAQALRDDERRSHLLDLAVDLIEAVMRAWSESKAWRDAWIARHRFRAALDGTGQRLPACRALLEIDSSPASMGDYDRRRAEADEALTAALDELSASLPARTSGQARAIAAKKIATLTACQRQKIDERAVDRSCSRPRSRTRSSSNWR